MESFIEKVRLELHTTCMQVPLVTVTKLFPPSVLQWEFGVVSLCLQSTHSLTYTHTLSLQVFFENPDKLTMFDNTLTH